MRRFFVLSAVMFFVLTGNLFAQNSLETALSKSKVQLNAGTGFYSGGFPIYAFADFKLSPDWSVGPQINFVFYDDFSFVVSGRADYHFNNLLNIPSAWDLYAGATMGIDFSHRLSFSSGIHVGGRWYWDKTWGLNVEIGGGTYFNSTVGISMKL